MTAGLKSGIDPSSRAAPAESDISLFELLTPLVRRWKLVAATALVCAFLAAIFLLLQRRSYTATTSFTPENSSNTGLMSNLVGLAGLAGQLGLGSSGSSSVSPEFFVRLVHSEEVLRPTLLTEFRTDSVSAPRPLLAILEVPGRSREEQLQTGVQILRKRTEAITDKATGIVTLKVTLQSPRLAADVANHLVELINKFNLESRQSQSREQRRFSGERLAVAEQELRAAEQAQLAFLQRNRQYMDSPLLTFEYSRLNRQVQLRQEVYQTLTKAHEEARIAEVRDTPVLTVIDSALAPVRPSGPHRILGTLVALIFGGVLGVSLAYVATARARARRSPTPDYLAFREAWEEAREASPRS